MIGRILAIGVVLFLGSFVLGTAVMIVKELIARRRAKTGDHKNIKGKEDDSSN